MNNSQRKNDDYWLSKENCLFNSYYNTFYLKNTKNHKVRCGIVLFNNDLLYGGDVNILTRNFNI